VRKSVFLEKMRMQKNSANRILPHLHKMTQSASLINFLRVAASFRRSSGGVMISKSSRVASRLRTCMPVVPASPSIKTFFLAKSDDDDDDNDDLIGFNVEKAEAWAAKRMKAADSFILLFLSKNFQGMMKDEKAIM
jgi:hypothetical protein